jgi:hypothetical protein
MSVLKLNLLFDLQQKVGELVISINSCPAVIIKKNAWVSVRKKCGYVDFNHLYYASPIHLYAHLGVCGRFYGGDTRVRRAPMKWSATAESFRHTGVDYKC